MIGSTTAAARRLRASVSSSSVDLFIRSSSSGSRRAARRAMRCLIGRPSRGAILAGALSALAALAAFAARLAALTVLATWATVLTVFTALTTPEITRPTAMAARTAPITSGMKASPPTGLVGITPLREFRARTARLLLPLTLVNALLPILLLAASRHGAVANLAPVLAPSPS